MNHGGCEQGIIVQVETLVPVWIQRPLADARRLCLLAIQGSDGEGIGKACCVLVSARVGA